MNGIFEFKGLTKGYYVIDEIVFPDGYIQVSGKPSFEVKVDTSGDLYIELVNDADGLVRLVDNEFTVIVGNTPGVALPHTGGPGARLYTIIGAVLIAGAGLLLWRRRRTI